VSGLATDVTTKLLQLLRDAVPGLTRVAILGASAVITRQTPDLEARAREAGLQLRFFEVRTPSEIEPAIEAAARQGSGGLLILPVQFLAVEERRLAHLAVKTRMPTVFWRRSFAEAGGLMAYGPDLYDLWHRLARQVDKVLKGTRPGDIPIEQASKFQLVVNLTAEQIGLTIPPALLIQADHVIR
jgi:putative ABC transport system substrate-binding protein